VEHQATYGRRKLRNEGADYRTEEHDWLCPSSESSRDGRGGSRSDKEQQAAGSRGRWLVTRELLDRGNDCSSSAENSRNLDTVVTGSEHSGGVSRSSRSEGGSSRLQP
jgi:hypothetical protein